SRALARSSPASSSTRSLAPRRARRRRARSPRGTGTAAVARSGSRGTRERGAGVWSCGRAVGDDLADREANRAPRASSEAGIVGDEHERRAARAGQFLHQADDAFAARGPETARRLVGEQDPRLMDERARERDALLLAARELRRIMIEPTAQAHALEQRGGPRGDVSVAAQLERHLHVLERGQRRQELERLKDEADVIAPETCPLVLGQRREIGAVDRDRAAARRVETREEPEQRCLAAARRA